MYGKVIYCRTLEIQILDEKETFHTLFIHKKMCLLLFDI